VEELSVKKYWSEKAARLTPYVAGEQPKERLLKLNTNENAYPPSPRVAEAIAAATDLRLYPATDARALREVIADREGLAPENVFCANGSDEALALAFLAFFSPGRPVRTADVTYSFYPVWARLFDLTLDVVPLKADYTVDVERMCGGKNVVIANPNAPTGIALEPGALEKIVGSTGGAVIVDEAYVAFGGQSAAALTRKYGNLAVVRTLSKSHSLAGLRVGCVLADAGLVAALDCVKDSFNSYTLGTPAQAGAAAALEDTAYYERTTLKIIAAREFTKAALEGMGLRVLPSAANFLFVRCADAAGTFAALRERGVLVRYFLGGRACEFLRVTIGTHGQMEEFLDAMRKVLGK
jgi:histidinol-phosphate aminotransferase